MRQTAWIIVLGLFWTHLSWGQETVTYVVQPKDSLYSIARHYGVTPLAIQQANHLANVRLIKIGQQLIIPMPASHPTISPPSTIQPVTPPIAATPPSTVPPSATTLPASNPMNPFPSSSPPPTRNEDSSPPRQYVFLDKVKDIIDAPTVVPGRWKYIVLHHSATPQGSAHAFDVAHRERGMVNGLAYHFVIGNGSFTGDGEIEVGSRWLRQIKGGHLKFDSLNEIAIGICFVGNFDETRPSRKQIAAAIELISYLREICGPVPPILMTHTEIHPHHTDCPGTLFPSAAFHALFPGDPDQAELSRLRAIPNP